MAVAKFVYPLIAVVIAGGGILLSGQEVKGPGGEKILRNANDYQAYNAQVRDLTLPAFTAVDAGELPTAQQKANAEKALPLLEAMNAYAPVKVGPYFSIGKIQAMLGRYEPASRAYEQAIANEVADQEEKGTDALKATVIEAKCLLSEVLLEVAVEEMRSAAGLPAEDAKRARGFGRARQERALTLAEEAVAARPDAPRYLAAQASALLALGREAEARAAVESARALDPDHFRVRPLVSLMGL